MEIIGSILSIIFISLLVGTALTFGFFLLAWFIGMALAMWMFMLLRGLWRRWRFLHSATQRERSAHITDAQYEDISNDKEHL